MRVEPGEASAAGTFSALDVACEYPSDERAFVVREVGTLEQVGAEPRRARRSPGAGASAAIGVVAAPEHVRYLHALADRRARVLRVLEQPVANDSSVARFLVAEHARAGAGRPRR